MKQLEKIKGITLIALVVTIIVLLILAGIAINLTIGNNGLFERAKTSVKKYNEAEIKEELETAIASAFLDTQGKGLTLDDIKNIVEDMGGIIFDEDDEKIGGEYKDHNITVDKDGNVTVGEEQLTGAKPTVEIKILTQGTGLELVELQVIAKTEEGEIESIEPINGAVLKTENSASDKIYEVTSNGVYKFKITGTNGRKIIANKLVDTMLMEMEAESILEGISRVETNGLVKMKVKGKTASDAAEEEITYRLDVIRKEGNVELKADEDDEVVEDLKLEGITIDKTNKIYSFGKSQDIGTASTYAPNTVVLKVEGDLTIDEGVTLTALGSAYGGPKGLVIYCTGTLTNNGTITMTARGAKAVGENVYLLKNKNTEETFEYIPAYGGAGAGAVGGKKLNGKTGGSAPYRGTGGGGSGGVGNNGGSSGAGASGTSYSGGTGGGGAGYGGSAGGKAGSANGGSGGWGAWNCNGGTGNPRRYQWWRWI